MRWNIHAGAGVLLLSITAGIAPAEASDRFPPSECEARVAYDRDMVLPGYLTPSKTGAKVCVPFTTVGARPPAGYKGDFYVDEFADQALRTRWLQCKADPVCAARVTPIVNRRKPPNREQHIADPHHRHLLGKVAERADLNLAEIRRPAFFAQAPYREPIAAVEANTYTVEFTAPAEAHERIHKGIEAPVKLRGWYM